MAAYGAWWSIVPRMIMIVNNGVKGPPRWNDAPNSETAMTMKEGRVLGAMLIDYGSWRMTKLAEPAHPEGATRLFMSEVDTPCGLMAMGPPESPPRVAGISFVCSPNLGGREGAERSGTAPERRRREGQHPRGPAHTAELKQTARTPQLRVKQVRLQPRLCACFKTVQGNHGESVTWRTTFYAVGLNTQCLMRKGSIFKIECHTHVKLRA